MDQLTEEKERKKTVEEIKILRGGDDEKNKNEILECFDHLKKQDSKKAESEKKSEKQKGRISSSTVVYRSLKSVLDHRSEFYPSNELFDEDLVYFPEKELQAMRDIQVCLTNDTGERMFLLYGHPASGKTVMGIAVGKALEEKGYEILYHKITDKSDIDKLWPDIHR